MRSFWIQGGSVSYNGCPYVRQKRKGMQRNPEEDRGRDWNARSPQELKTLGRILP